MESALLQVQSRTRVEHAGARGVVLRRRAFGVTDAAPRRSACSWATPMPSCSLDALDAHTRAVVTPSAEVGGIQTPVVVSVCHRRAPEVLRPRPLPDALRSPGSCPTASAWSTGCCRRSASTRSRSSSRTRVCGGGSPWRWKRASDVALAVALLVLLLPLLAVVAVLIKRDSPGPVLFSQDRIGRRGRTFRIFKFRTMVQDAHEQERHVASACAADPRFVKIDCDPRVTRLGRLLRKTSIDELPQLWNVIRGDMSFVGPRPSQPSEVAHYERDHFARLLVRPGITGMWQVSGRSDLGFEDAVALDTQYVRDWGPLLDLRILARTVLVVLNCRGAC